MSDHFETALYVPHRHVEGGFAKDWFAVEVAGQALIINEAGQGRATAYTVGETTKNPRVIANADAVLWDGMVGLTYYEDGLVSISHRFAGIEETLPVDVWLGEAVATLQKTDQIRLKGVGGHVEFECIDCGEHIKRERREMDIPGLTPSRCTSCTFDRMGERT